ncbi:MAG TPA: alpha/beta fold hydrolase [Limnochordia bacterium]
MRTDRGIGYEVAGAGEPVVFVHAFPLHRAAWAAQLAALGDRYRCIAVDVPGFGESDPPAGALSMDEIARAVADVLDTLGVSQPATIVGNSIGGYTAFAIWRLFPQRVRALVLCDTRAQPDTPEGRRARAETAARVEARGVAVLVEEMLPKLVGPTTIATRPDVVARVRAMIESAQPKSVVAALQGLAERPDARPTLPTITVPTLIVVGKEDAISPPADARLMHDAIAGSELLEVDAAGHLAALERPDAFNATLAAFLAKL